MSGLSPSRRKMLSPPIPSSPLSSAFPPRELPQSLDVPRNCKYSMRRSSMVHWLIQWTVMTRTLAQRYILVRL